MDAPTRSLGPPNEYLLGLSELPDGPPSSEGPVQNVGILSIPATPVLLSTHNNSAEGDPLKAAFRGSVRSIGRPPDARTGGLGTSLAQPAFDRGSRRAHRLERTLVGSRNGGAVLT